MESRFYVRNEVRKIEFQDYEIDIKKIKPKNVKRSDKYSKEIYKYLKNNPWYKRVWFDEASYDEDNKPVLRQFDINNINLRRLYFGLPDFKTTNCITGKCLSGLLSGSRCAQESYYYITEKHSHFVEVTKEFYEKYIEIGRCIYGHHLYLNDSENRYTYIDDTHRICNWCGQEQHEETITYTYERKEWKNDEKL